MYVERIGQAIVYKTIIISTIVDSSPHFMRAGGL